MIRFLRGILGLPNKPVAPATPPRSGRIDDFARLNSLVPLQDSDDNQRSLIRREAILNRAERIIGYEFSLLTTLQIRLQQRRGMAKRAFDAVLLTRLTRHSVNSLLGHRLAFVNLAIESLKAELLDALPAQNTVLMFDLPPPDADWANVIERIAELKRKGFSCGLRIHDAKVVTSPLLGNLDFIQIDITAFDGLDLRSLVRDLRAKEPAGQPPIRLIARGVPSHDDFMFCSKCQFDLFQGPFVSSRESLQPVTVGNNRLAILPILNMVRNDENFAAIAAQLKIEPTLTFKLLRYLNSPAMGLHRPIDNLTDALALVGREMFYRWMSLLMFEFTNPGYRERALTESALARARTLELLAGKGQVPAAPDQLFLIGLFSALDVVLGLPLPELLNRVTLPQTVRDALLGVPSTYANALALVTLNDKDATTQEQQMALALERCGLHDQDYAPIAADALVWAQMAIGDAS
jgi:EAL and modified HD-GYP domain-containing signal transduction protein